LIHYVLDANVAAKWFLPSESEPHTEEAHQLLADLSSGTVEAIVPDLYWLEIGNVLWKAVRQGRITAAMARKAIPELETLSIATVPTQPITKDALDFAIHFDRTVYDAVYVRVAIATGCSLLTNDDRLVNALSSRFPVRWLGAYQSPG
jgi:predicted nucleic acid-binding protein